MTDLSSDCGIRLPARSPALRGEGRECGLKIEMTGLLQFRCELQHPGDQAHSYFFKIRWATVNPPRISPPTPQ